MNLNVEHRTPTVQEYQELRRSTNWSDIEDSLIEIALLNSKFAVCITDGDKTIAMGRIIGDGVYFYVQDVIVLPKYRQKGIGKKVMAELEKWVERSAEPNSFIGLMAAKGTAGFYKKFNYTIRGIDNPGMFKIKEVGSEK